MLRSSKQDDVLLRIVREAGRALALLRSRLTDTPEAAPEVRREVAASLHTLLGNEAMLLTALDAGNAVRLVGDAATVSCWVAFLELDADAAAVAGHAAESSARRARARSLAEAARVAFPETSDDVPS